MRAGDGLSCIQRDVRLHAFNNVHVHVLRHDDDDDGALVLAVLVA